MWQIGSKRSLYFVLNTAPIENPASHKYEVIKYNKTFVAFLTTLLLIIYEPNFSKLTEIFVKV